MIFFYVYSFKLVYDFLFGRFTMKLVLWPNTPLIDAVLFTPRKYIFLYTIMHCKTAVPVNIHIITQHQCRIYLPDQVANFVQLACLIYGGLNANDSSSP